MRAGPGRRAWVPVLLDLPQFALSVLIVVFLVVVIGVVPWGLVVAGVWLASGGLLLIPAVEDVVMSGIGNLRRPTADERRRVDPAWEVVCRRAGVDAARFTLWVEQSEAINGFASAGHTVALTSRASRVLEAEHLQALLAHELGHHMDRHAWSGLLRFWYGLPAAYTLSFAGYLSQALLAACLSGSAVMMVAVGVIVVGATVGALIALPVLGAAIVVALVLPFGARAVGRSKEHQADLYAARLGYGLSLLSVLEGTAGPSARGRRRAWLQRVSSTHPSHEDRVRFIEERPVGPG